MDGKYYYRVVTPIYIIFSIAIKCIMNNLMFSHMFNILSFCSCKHYIACLEACKNTQFLYSRERAMLVDRKVVDA